MAGCGERVVVCAVARSPFGRFNGRLAPLSGPRLGAMIIDALLKRADLQPDAVDLVCAGVGMLGGAALTAVRQAVLLSSLPQTTPSIGNDRACCSGMTAIGLAYRLLAAGGASAIVCGGFESLSRTPLLWPRPQSTRIGPVVAADPLQMRGDVVDRPIAVYTGDEALQHGVTRAMQDEWALGSHERYFAAQATGYFEFERIPVAVPAAKGGVDLVGDDESPRSDTTLEKLARLTPIYDGATVTAGNAPGLNDGAAFLLLATESFARARALPVLAHIDGHEMVASGPTSGTSTPAIAIKAALDREALSPAALDLIEINEAFAATPLVSTRRLADADAARWRRLRERTNTCGGAVAIGHPLGASGARIAMTLINGLRRRGGGRGVAAICGGFGQGEAVLLRVDAKG